MGKQKKDKELFEHGVITQEAITAYLHNELTAEEKQQFDKLLAEDPFAQDALEGLRAAESTAATRSIASINKKITARVGGKEAKTVRLHWTNYAWAAAIIGILVAVGFFIINYRGKTDDTIATTPPSVAEQQTIIAAQKQPELTAAGIADTNTIIKNTFVDSTATGPLAQQNNIVKQPAPASNNGQPAMNSTLTATTSGTGGNGLMNNNTKPLMVENNNQKGNDAPVQPGEKNMVSMNKSANLRTENGEGKKKDEKESGGGNTGKDSGKEVSVDEAMKNFNLGEYKTSGDQFDIILKKQPDNAQALYYGGISDYLNNKPVKAEKNFDKLVKSSNNFSEGSKWYKARILLDKGKKEEAKKLLLELSNSNGSYKEKATKKLQELQ